MYSICGSLFLPLKCFQSDGKVDGRVVELELA